MSTFGGSPFSGTPFAGIEASSDTFVIYADLELVFPTSFVFFGEIGDIILIPPGLVVPPSNLNDRRSPCLLYEP